MALLVFLSATAACARPAQTAPAASSQEPIEEFTQETLAQYGGQVVLLNFWATWCPPCRQEMPAMEAVYREYRDRGAVIVAVNIKESDEAILAFASKLDLTFPILRDSQGKAMNANGILFLPTTLFLNQDGQVVSRHVGTMDEDMMSTKIEELLP